MRRFGDGGPGRLTSHEEAGTITVDRALFIGGSAPGRVRLANAKTHVERGLTLGHDQNSSGELLVDEPAGLTVDGGAPAGVNLDNDTGRIDHVRVGAVDGSITTTTGVMLLDEFLSFR